MKRKKFNTLKVGDRVRIVSKRPNTLEWNVEMDEWLGKVMTIRERDNACGVCKFVRMVEDAAKGYFRDGWYWYPEMLAEKVPEVKEVKRRAKVGEYIKIVKPMYAAGYYESGDILKVINVNDRLSAIVETKKMNPARNNAKEAVVWDMEYVVLEGYEPPKEEKKEEPVTVVEHLIRDRKTIVKLSNGKVGTAVCNPDDKFDFYEGLCIATARAYGQEEKIEKKPKVKEVKRAAKVGEYIKIVKAGAFSTNCYSDGDILKVYKTEKTYFGDGDIGVYCDLKKKLGPSMCKMLRNDNGNVLILESEYVVLEGYEPEKK